LLISPAVVLELEYLSEIHRFTLRAQPITRKLEREVGVRICSLGFAEVVAAGLEEEMDARPF